MANDCCTEKNIVVFTCSGAANVGQAANQAAVELQLEGTAKMLCLAGIGSHNSGMIASGKGADRVVGIDGCPVACTKKALEHADVPINDHLIVTELGFKKHPYDGNIDREAVEKIKTEVKRKLSTQPLAPSSGKESGYTCSCC
ncbi:MAG: putative zinc-binding protein [Desulfobacterota bacterium]|nr:putative zinc-binding protein [Thermodesulfobacteriota bacterium]